MSDSFRAFRNPAFVRYQMGRVCGIVAMQVLSVAVGWQVYELTGRPMDLGWVGLVQFLPLALFWPVTGVIVDRSDRKRVIVGTYIWQVAMALALAGIAARGGGLAAILGVLFLIASGRALAAPASSAILPQLIPTEDFANAATWSSTLSSVASIVGPAIGGAIYAWAGGATVAYVASAVMLAIGGSQLARLPLTLARGNAGAMSWGAAIAGVRFILATPVLFGAITLDLFAVLLGGAVALLPVVAKDVLHTGPDGLGLLRAAPAVGAALVAFFLAFRPVTRRVGVLLLATVSVFGLATIAFGLATSFGVALIALVVAGGSDEVSVFIRQNVVTLATPNALRGRVSAAEFVFIGASNELGEMESGIVAAWLGVVPAIVLGGVGTLVVVVVTAVFARELRDIDRFSELTVRADAA